jgi:hypothetical protein
MDFYLSITVMMVLASATIGEALICLSPDKDRSFYSSIPAMGFVLFFFSGLMIRSDTLPEWTQSWLPSVSIIRWSMQGMTINRFEGTGYFPTILNFSVYDAVMSSLGWGGKSKGYCQDIVLLNMMIFRGLTFFALLLRAKTQDGHRTQNKPDDDVHSY